MIEILIALIGGWFAGYVGAISSSGGLISVPILLALGLPADVAIGTNRFTANGMLIGAIPRYRKAKSVSKDLLKVFIPIALVGGIIGSQLLVRSDVESFQVGLGVVFLLMVPTLYIGKNFGLKSQETSLTKKVIGAFLYCLIMVYAGMVGAGIGIFIALTMTYFFGLTYMEAISTNMIPWLVLTVVLTVIFAYEGLIDYEIGMPMLVGMYLGGRFGASHAIKRGNGWIRFMLALAVSATGIKLILG